MKLGQTKMLGVFDQHHSGVGNIHSHFDHGRRYQNVQFSLHKGLHHGVFFFTREAAMQEANAELREDVMLEVLRHGHCGTEIKTLRFLDEWIDDI